MAKSEYFRASWVRRTLGLCALLWGACGHSVQAQAVRAQGDGYELQVLVDGVPESNYRHAGEDYVMGRLGARYTLRVINHTGRRIEAVVSVDGRDVIDGKRADFKGKRGYLVPAWGSIDIDGWRLSAHQAAAFRFASVADSYAARTGSARHVGVIGAAIFPERHVPPPVQMPVRPYSPHYETAPSATSAGPALESDRSEAMDSDRQAESMATGRGAMGNEAAPQKRRSGLGTEFGEAVSSHITEVEFVRATPKSPARLLGVRYNDRDGLIAMGVGIEPRCDAECREIELRKSASPFPVSYRRYAAPPSGWRSF
jgi:hypothetical protein